MTRGKNSVYFSIGNHSDGFLGNCFLTFQEHKVLLTGTPLQNTVEELFSLLHFLEPGRFPSETTFMQEFGDLKTEEQVNLFCTLTFLFRYCEFIHFIAFIPFIRTSLCIFSNNSYLLPGTPWCSL